MRQENAQCFKFTVSRLFVTEVAISFVVIVVEFFRYLNYLPSRMVFAVSHEHLECYFYYIDIWIFRKKFCKI